jgi:flagellar hook-length control protein FliK
MMGNDHATGAPVKGIEGLKDGLGRLFSPPTPEAGKIASFDGQRLNLLVAPETSQGDRLNVSSPVSHHSWQTMTAQDQNLMLFETNGKKNFGEEMKSSQPLPQGSDFSLLVSSIPVSAEERVRAGDPPASADWPRVINRVAGEIISSVRHNKHEAFINLEPPELGGIKIAISLEGDRVHARISAEAHESGRLIENHVAELKQALQLQSLDLVDLRIESGNWSGARSDQEQSFRQGFERHQEWRDGSRDFFAPNITSEDGEVQRSSSTFLANSRVSVWA